MLCKNSPGNATHKPCFFIYCLENGTLGKGHLTQYTAVHRIQRYAGSQTPEAKYETHLFPKRITISRSSTKINCTRIEMGMPKFFFFLSSNKTESLARVIRSLTNQTDSSSHAETTGFLSRKAPTQWRVSHTFPEPRRLPTSLLFPGVRDRTDMCCGECRSETPEATQESINSTATESGKGPRANFRKGDKLGEAPESPRVAPARSPGPGTRVWARSVVRTAASRALEAPALRTFAALARAPGLGRSVGFPAGAEA